MGYSHFTVLSSSMHNEIPKGSFILVQDTPAKELQIGDNIAFMRDRSTLVAHKIIDIDEDYQESGARGFMTQGVNNDYPDNEIVSAIDVLGKVVFTLPVAGSALLYLKNNIHLAFISLGLFVILSLYLRGLLAKRGSGGALQEEPGLYKAAAS